jgi:hypothetical protein
MNNISLYSVLNQRSRLEGTLYYRSNPWIVYWPSYLHCQHTNARVQILILFTIIITS